MTFGSLFSGIGGLDLGLEWAGMECAWQSEIDLYASRVLAKHWPHVRNYGDIKAIDPATLPPVDLVCGGYPCQPFSYAGDRKGAADNRHLWPVMLKVIEVMRPSWVLCENVDGHVTMGLDQVLSDLESRGYAGQAFVVPACAVDAPHRRYRVFIVSHVEGIAVEEPKMVGQEEIHGEVLRESGRMGGGARVGWQTDQPSMVGMVDGVPNWVDRCRALGNSVVPQVAYEFGIAMMQAHYGESVS